MECMDGRIAKLEKTLKKASFVSHAYIFGSVAAGKPGPLSDIDIAVSFKPMDRAEMAKKKLYLVNKISSVLGTDKFDLVVMNTAGTNMKFSIIKEGKVLKDSPHRIEDEVGVISAYLDRKYYDDIYDSALVDRVVARGLL